MSGCEAGWLTSRGGVWEETVWRGVQRRALPAAHQSIPVHPDQLKSCPCCRLLNHPAHDPARTLPSGGVLSSCSLTQFWSAEQKESLDDVMVEVVEAVKQHWLNVRLHYIAVVMGYLTGAFLYMGFVVRASGRA